MIDTTRYVVYPEGDRQGIDHALGISALVGLNGERVDSPAPNGRQILYRVGRITTASSRNEEATLYWLELLSRPEIATLANAEGRPHGRPTKGEA